MAGRERAEKGIRDSGPRFGVAPRTAIPNRKAAGEPFGLSLGPPVNEDQSVPTSRRPKTTQGRSAKSV